MEKKALGRGLAALIPDTGVAKGEGVTYLRVNSIKTGKFQPREDFNSEKLNELIASIKERGVIQPIIVRRSQGENFELVAGERRLRAVKELGIESLPAIVKDVDDQGAFEIALIENLQREELNPVEQARAYERLIAEFAFTQEKVSQSVGKDKATISNSLRLLKLPKTVQDRLAKGEISTGHAKAILSLPSTNDQMLLCDRIIKKGLSVREAEDFTKRRAVPIVRKSKDRDQNITAIEDSLMEALGSKVEISCNSKNAGEIKVKFYSLEDFDRIVKVLTAGAIQIN